MSAQGWDWLAVAATVAFAAAWLGFRVRRALRKQREGRKPGQPGACGSTCAGCPYTTGCGGRRD